MIEVHLYLSPEKEERITGFDLEGHADSAPHGEDLVCCAVSTLATATVNAIREVAGLAQEAQIQAREGKLSLHLKRIQGSENKRLADFSLQVFQYNIDILADQYPEYIHVTKRKDGTNEI